MKSYFFFGLIFFSVLFSSHYALAEPNCSGVADKGDYFNFSTACFKHDVCYSEAPLVGMTKKSCDDRFYTHMKASCRGRLDCLLLAYFYHQGVKAMSMSVFDAAAAKGTRIQSLIQANNDDEATALFARRSRNQVRWTAKNTECSKLSGSLRDTCLSELRSISIPDIPGEYNLGGCNTLGVRWSKGDRASNAFYQAKTLGVPLEQITDPNIQGDPCEGFYLD